MVVTLSVVAIAQSSTYKHQDLKSQIAKERLGYVMHTSHDKPVTLTTMPNALQAKVETNLTAYNVTPKAPAAEIDTVEVYFDSFYEDPLFYEAGDWLIVLKNERFQFNFDFFGGTPESPAGTYDIEDIDVWFSWCMFPEAEGKTSYYKTCELTIKEEVISANKTKYYLDAFIVSTLGVDGEVNGVFTVHAEHEMVTPSVKLDVAILNCTVAPEEDRFRIWGKDDTISVDMTIFSEFGVVGYYSHKSIDPEATSIVHRDRSFEVMEMEGVIFTADMITGGVAYVFMTEVTTTDSSFFNIAMEAPIIPIDTVRVNCINMQLDGSDGSTQATITMTGSDKAYSILAGYNDTKITAPATYSGQQAMAYVTELATNKTISSLQCTIEIDEDKALGYVVHIEMLGEDHKYYIFDLAWNVPTPVKTVTLDFPNPSKSMYYIDDLGLEELQLANYNEEYSVAFDILYIDRILLVEEFTLENLWADQTFIVHHTEDQDTYVPIAEVKGTIKQQKGVTYLTATVLGFDSVQYDIKMYHSIPTPTETITYVFNGLEDGKDEVTFTNALPQGIFILEAMSEDGQLMANVQVNRIQTESIVGKFYNDGQFTHNDFFSDNTFVQVWNDSIEDFDEYYVQKGELNVEIDENNIITAVASFICDDSKQYNLTFKTPYERAHLAYDNETGSINYTYASDSYATVVDWIEGYEKIWLELVPKDYANVAAFYFRADKMDPEIGIPAGVYPITSSPELGTVVASKGVAVAGYPLESYYCGLQVEEDEDGEMAIYYDQEALFCMVDGTVTVEKLENNVMKLTVDAINSYDRPIKISYTGPVQTDVENVTTNDNANVTKQLINGQLYIIKNGVHYNILGTIVK